MTRRRARCSAAWSRPEHPRNNRLACFFFDGLEVRLHNAPRLGSQGALVAQSHDSVVC